MKFNNGNKAALIGVIASTLIALAIVIYALINFKG